MAKNAKVERTQKLFLEAMKKKFSEDPDLPATKRFPEPTRPSEEHATLLPVRSCKPDPFDEEADRKYDRMIGSRDDQEMKGYQRK